MNTPQTTVAPFKPYCTRLTGEQARRFVAAYPNAAPHETDDKGNVTVKYYCYTLEEHSTLRSLLDSIR